MIKTDITLPFGYSTDDIFSALAARLPISKDEIREVKIVKRTLNLSDKQNIHYSVTVGISLSEEREAGLLKMRKKVSAMEDLSFRLPACRFDKRPLVVGTGPAGLFAALLLAEQGAKPVVIERGLAVDERTKKVDLFNTLAILDTECNVQFGEGGAGTFSDGKLKVGSMDKYKYKVLSEFISAGAPEDIIYSVGAHVGTDKLKNIVQKIRQKIISLGGDVLFSTRLTELKISDGRVEKAICIRDGEKLEIETDIVVLATGHSARDVFSELKRIGAPLEAKGFGVGLRIEHPREYIDRIMYGSNPPEGIGASSYHLVTHLASGRSVYSFCMCPGGSVVAAASEQGGIVTNGMSEYARDAENSNAAFLVSVTPQDFATDDPLSGIDFQKKIERTAFKIAGSTYRAPATCMGAFINGEKPRLGSVKPSYSIGAELISPEKYLPEYVTDSLKESISDFDKWMPGFYLADAAMTGPETRTTSPIRVLRDAHCEAIGIKGLYPSGEGAGCSGGIVSSARDGLIVAEKIIEKNAK